MVCRPSLHELTVLYDLQAVWEVVVSSSRVSVYRDRGNL